MITINNYDTATKNINWSKLPDALQSGHSNFHLMVEHYDNNEKIKDVLDRYIEKLNIAAGKLNASKPKAKTKAKAGTKTKAKSGPKKKPYEGAQVEIRPIDKDSSIYEIWDASKKQRWANERFKTLAEARRFAKQNGFEVLNVFKAKKKNTRKPKVDNAKRVERVSEEVKLIKRYVLLHEKVKTKKQILLFINAMQRAIVEKRIRKSSKYAKEINYIQEQLVKLYNKMGAQTKIEIGEPTLSKYKLIAGGEKAMLSISYIKRYFSLHGKTDVREKARDLMKKLKAAVKKKKLNEDDPYKKQLEVVYKSLLEYTTGITKTPKISKAQLNGLRGIAKMEPLFSKKKAQEIPELKGMPDVISTEELSRMQFDTIGLKGKYKDLIGDPSVGFSCMVYGKPKSGKSTMSIDFAHHLAAHHGKVLYAAIEEGYGYTMKEKLQRLNAVHSNLFISEQIPDNLSAFDFVFIDSVSKGKVDNNKLNELITSNPKTAFIFIFHSTKSGDFRGGQENAHDVDCLIEVADGVATGKGRFGVGGEMVVFG